MDHCWVKHPHLRPILHRSRSRGTTRNLRDRGRPHDCNKHRESTAGKGEENRVSKEYGKRRNRNEREPSSDEHPPSSSEYSPESDDAESQPQRKRKNHAKTLHAIPIGKNMTGVINHTWMVRPTSQGTKNGNTRWLMDSGASNPLH